MAKRVKMERLVASRNPVAGTLRGRRATNQVHADKRRRALERIRNEEART